VGLAVRIVARCLTEPARQRRRVALRGQSDQGRTRWVTAYAGGHNHQTMCVRHQTSWSAAPCTDRGWPRPRSPGLADKGCPGLGRVAPDSGLIRPHKGGPDLARHQTSWPAGPRTDNGWPRPSWSHRPKGGPGLVYRQRVAPASRYSLVGWPRPRAAGKPQPWKGGPGLGQIAFLGGGNACADIFPVCGV
jgi:hypothetical protein